MARASQPETFDSTAKLMLEALAKASAELEKSVTAFTEQLISFNEGVQRSLEEELRMVNQRLEGSIRNSLDELGHNKHLMMKRVLEAERAELDALSDSGKQVRHRLSTNAQQIEKKIEEFIETQIAELKRFLEQPQSNIESAAKDCRHSLDEAKDSAAERIKSRQEQFRRNLTEKVEELEQSIKQETEKAREAVAAVSQTWANTLQSERETFSSGIAKFGETAVDEIEQTDVEGNNALDESEDRDQSSLKEVGQNWKEQVNSHSASFRKLIANLSTVLKDNFETKLANASEQARQEITMLSDQAHEKISVTRNELEVELRDMEKDYIQQLQNSLRKLEQLVNEHANDKRNSGVARQHKAQKLRDQMHGHLKRWGGSLVDSIKDASSEMENEFNRATDGFHVRIDATRASAIELLERESKLMQKDLDRVLKEFQRELSEQEVQINKIENAGQDAVVTVIACRKAMLSFKGEGEGE